MDEQNQSGRIPWPYDALVVLDVETTGFNPKEDRVVEIAAARFDVNGLARLSSLLDPGRPMPEKAAAVNGITDEMLEGKPAFKDMAEQLAGFCEGAHLVAYNEPFDRSFVTAELRRAGREPWYDPDASWIDPLAWVRKLDKYVKGSGRHKLTVTCKRRGVRLEGDAHRALTDTIATGRLLLSMAKQIGPLLTVDELLAKQKVLAAHQQQEYEQWRARGQG